MPLAAPLTRCNSTYHSASAAIPAAKLSKRVSTLHNLVFFRHALARLTPTPQGLILRRWDNPLLRNTAHSDETCSREHGLLHVASLSQCIPNVVVVIACSHTSLNQSAREAVVAGALKAQAMLYGRFVCVQSVIDTRPVPCDHVLPLSASFFDLPLQAVIPPHSKVLLITGSDEHSLTLCPPRTLPPSIVICINTILDTTSELRRYKDSIKNTITAAYDQPSSLADVMALKASKMESRARAEASAEEALDAAFVLALLAFGCKVMCIRKLEKQM